MHLSKYISEGKKDLTMFTSLFFIRFKRIISLLLIAISLSSCGKSTIAENTLYFTTQAQVDFDTAITGRLASWDALRKGTPAAAIDITDMKSLMRNYIEQASLLQKEYDLRKKIDPNSDTGDIITAYNALRDRSNNLLFAGTGLFDKAQNALNLYKIVSALPEYTKEQKKALAQCKKSLEEGKWDDAITHCTAAQKAAVPPSPTPTGVPTSVTTPGVEITPILLLTLSPTPG